MSNKGLFSFFKKWASPTSTETIEETGTPTSAEEMLASIIPAPSYKNTHYETKSTTIITQEMIDYAINQLEIVLKLSGFGGKVILKNSENGQLLLEIIDAEDVGRIIGKEGMTLEAFQTLGKTFLFQKFNVPVRLYLDIEDYRKKRIDSLVSQAEKASKTVLTRARKVDLKPMNPEERRLIHGMFQNDKKIRSYSVGNGLYRHIVLERRGGRNQAPATSIEE